MSQNVLPKPINRGNFRLKMGSLYFSTRRILQWYTSNIRYAKDKCAPELSQKEYGHVLMRHESTVMRELRNVDAWMQTNKKRNLELAIAQLNGIILHPGETLSLWRLIGRPSKRKGYLPGMVLVNGEMRSGYGGGLCQLSNLIYWMTLHTELTVTERFRHQYDVFPDSRRTLPFGSGATIAYNYIDLQIRNDSPNDHCLRLSLSPTHLHGEWRSPIPAKYTYQIYECNHHITQHSSGKYLRHNEIWRRKIDDEGDCVAEECVAENHAIMMYSPLLAAPADEKHVNRNGNG